MRDSQLKNIAGIQPLVKFFCQSDSLTNKITDWLIETGGDYLTIVFNGYDEMSDDKKQFYS